ncbi:hypothetical protein XAB3213_330013 [Xanthomonas citri pv. bilvae]|nr:hypothetical protein XAB3213_330013 [Xanthomonas citri pv. bilvae]
MWVAWRSRNGLFASEFRYSLPKGSGRRGERSFLNVYGPHAIKKRGAVWRRFNVPGRS